MVASVDNTSDVKGTDSVILGNIDENIAEPVDNQILSESKNQTSSIQDKQMVVGLVQ